MSSSLELFPDHLPQVDYQELYSGTWDQLEKDFHPYYSLGSKPPILSAEILFSEAQTALQVILARQSSELDVILYRIDLKERKTSTNIEHLAYLVVRREAQKVWLRKSFS